MNLSHLSDSFDHWRLPRPQLLVPGFQSITQALGQPGWLHFHILFLDGVCVERPDGAVRFRSVRAPTSAELTHLAHIIAQRVGCFLQRQGQLELDAENSCLASDAVDDEAMNSLMGHSITYRIAIGPHARRKVFTLQAHPGCIERFDDGVGKAAGFMHGASDFVDLATQLKC